MIICLTDRMDMVFSSVAGRTTKRACSRLLGPGMPAAVLFNELGASASYFFTYFISRRGPTSAP